MGVGSRPPHPPMTRRPTSNRQPPCGPKTAAWRQLGPPAWMRSMPSHPSGLGASKLRYGDTKNSGGKGPAGQCCSRRVSILWPTDLPARHLADHQSGGVKATDTQALATFQGVANSAGVKAGGAALAGLRLSADWAGGTGISPLRGCGHGILVPPSLNLKAASSDSERRRWSEWTG